MAIFLFQAVVFLSAFLIFQIELVLGKIILPGFGGGYLVWGISMVLYQGLLFLGYLYVHLQGRATLTTIMRSTLWTDRYSSIFSAMSR